MSQHAKNAAAGGQPSQRTGRSSSALQRRWLGLALAFLAVTAFADEPGAADVSAETQRRVNQILQNVIQEYWHGVKFTNSNASMAQVTYTNLETAFREASKLMPYRLDLRLNIASLLIAQATQTNGQQLQLKVKEALGLYQEIQRLDSAGFEAPILYAAYARAIGDTNASDGAIERLMAVDPRRTEEYLERFRRADSLLQTMPNEKPRKNLPQDEYHAIVILGAGLETNGTMKAKLVARLRQGLKLARIYPSAPIILTGGNPRRGVTEAYAMGRWLTRRGISRERLILEDQAQDTVGNAVYSSAILQYLGATHVTLVTSASHMRRGLADLQEACLQRELDLQYDHLAAWANGDTDLDKEQERVGVYRDVMRASGLWSFPGIQQ